MKLSLFIRKRSRTQRRKASAIAPASNKLLVLQCDFYKTCFTQASVTDFFDEKGINEMGRIVES
ncbi:MAG TPA: hypothetical protein DCP31_07290 [Cyanobacteria bacterium UBA8543]|nr:hypothetical protein [Cyanobacteria bacterium UBA8543]